MLDQWRGVESNGVLLIPIWISGMNFGQKCNRNWVDPLTTNYVCACTDLSLSTVIDFYPVLHSHPVFCMQIFPNIIQLVTGSSELASARDVFPIVPVETFETRSQSAPAAPASASARRLRQTPWR